MPCTDGGVPYDTDRYERDNNKRDFGFALTNRDWAARSACNAIKLVERLGVLDNLEPVTLAWWKKHQAIDRQRTEQENKQARCKAIRKTALMKLSKEEKRELGL